MTLSFNTMCALVVVGSLITTLVIGPLMWDAAEYVENILVTMHPYGDLNLETK